MSDDRNAIEARINAVERLTTLFRLERSVYLAATIISLVLVLASAIWIMVKLKDSPKELVVAVGPLFGSSGLIAYSTSRLLRMWDTAMRVLMHGAEGQGGE
jgi:hypothetical protein